MEDAERQRLGVSRHHSSGNIRDANPPVSRLNPQDPYQSRRLSPERVPDPYAERRSSAETRHSVAPSRHLTTVSEHDRHSTAQTASRRTPEQIYEREPAVSRVPQPRDSDRDLSRQQRQESDHYRRSRHDSVMEEETGQGRRHGGREVRRQRTVGDLEDDLEPESEEDNKRDRYGRR